MSENTGNNTDITYGKSESDIKKIIAIAIRADREKLKQTFRNEAPNESTGVAFSIYGISQILDNTPIGDE